MNDRLCKLRSLAQTSATRARLPTNLANIALGTHYFLQFALETGAISSEEREALWASSWQALGNTSAGQEQHQLFATSELRFLEGIASALRCGQAPLLSMTGLKPDFISPASVGWVRDAASRNKWNPRGRKIGCLDGNEVYLDPEASYRLAREQSRHGEQIVIGQSVLHRRLADAGLLNTTDAGRKRLTVRRTIESSRTYVLHLSFSTLFPDAALLAVDGRRLHLHETRPP